MSSSSIILASGISRRSSVSTTITTNSRSRSSSNCTSVHSHCSHSSNLLHISSRKYSPHPIEKVWEVIAYIPRIRSAIEKLNHVSDLIENIKPGDQSHANMWQAIHNMFEELANDVVGDFDTGCARAGGLNNHSQDNQEVLVMMLEGATDDALAEIKPDIELIGGCKLAWTHDGGLVVI